MCRSPRFIMCTSSIDCTLFANLNMVYALHSVCMGYSRISQGYFETKNVKLCKVINNVALGVPFVRCPWCASYVEPHVWAGEACAEAWSASNCSGVYIASLSPPCIISVINKCVSCKHTKALALFSALDRTLFFFYLLMHGAVTS